MDLSSIKWETRFEIGHKRIDFEHMIFFDLVMTLKDCLKGKGDLARADRILNEIIMYAQFHFVSEENIMEEVDYPDLATHRELHADLIDSFNNKLVAGDLDALLAFLLDWFVKHTSIEDKKTAAFVASVA